MNNENEPKNEEINNGNNDAQVDETSIPQQIDINQQHEDMSTNQNQPQVVENEQGKIIQ
jgi:hypothetical protein